MKLGIVGGGQLALMLAESASQLGLEVGAFVSSDSEPVTRVCRDIYIGEVKSTAFQQFLGKFQRVIFESEFVDCAMLDELSKDIAVTFYPSLRSMGIFQDKLLQKRFCVANGLPTAEFLVFDGTRIDPWIDSVLSQFGGNAVFKWARMGYDGKGNFFARRDYDRHALVGFIHDAESRGSDVYAEKLVSFESELAVVATRSVLGEVVSYPVVFSEQEEGICRTVWGPAVSLGLKRGLADMISNISRVVGEKGELIGTYAVELFLKDEKVYVNEIAPRVHNSAHYSQDACVVSQFENHIRAVCGLPLGAPDARAFFGMYNLLGPSGSVRTPEALPIPEAHMRLHWYGKREVRAKRKLGHINVVGQTREELKERLVAARAVERKWYEELLG